MADLPIVTQPGLGVTTTTVTTITQTGGDWSTGLFNVCSDKTICVVGAVSPCCLDLSLANQYGECLFLPLLPDYIEDDSSLIVSDHPLQGSVCGDWAAVYFCYPLAVCQMIRELKRRIRTQIYHVSTTLECS
ncbi:PL8L1 protein, partial [Amia calva]|nr:PL8L1 protein [Amia calva]